MNKTRIDRSLGLACFLVFFGGATLEGQELRSASNKVVWKTQQLAGWNLYVSDTLLSQQSEATTRAVKLLQQQLEQIVEVVPAAAVKQLQQVPLYFSPSYPGQQPRAEFHPSAGWLRDNGRDPVMAEGVEFSNIEIFEQEVNRMPNFALHELAHAYHFRFLPDGFENAKVAAVFLRAKASGSYDSVERWYGNGRANTKERAYALSNPMEYFAESSEAYFTRNDFFPFTAEELRVHDPTMFALLGELWGVTTKTATESN